MPKPTKHRKKISEQTLADRLKLMIEKATKHVIVGTFEQHGVMTYNKGLVVTLPNRQQFQITIVDSTPGF